MLTLAYFSDDAGTGALPLETLQSAFQRFILFYSNFRHLFFPPFATLALAIAVYTADGDRACIITLTVVSVNSFFGRAAKKERKEK